MSIKALLTRIINRLNDTKDYVVETGTNGIWNYRKFADNTYVAEATVTLTLATGTAWNTAGYYHTTQDFTRPSFGTNAVTVQSAVSNNAQLGWVCGVNNSTSTFKLYWFNGVQASSSNIVCRLTIRGNY